MSNENEWGVGDQAEAKPFDTVLVGSDNPVPADLITGEHPHSRRMHNHQYARLPDGTIHAFEGHRTLIDVTVTSSNYLKSSYLSGDEIRKAVNFAIFADRTQVYEGFARDPQYALLKAHQLIGELHEHSSGWLSKQERDKLSGRKVFYREVAALITRLATDQGCVIIETADGKPFPAPVYLDQGEEDEQETSVKVEVLSEHIWWFRN